MSFLNCLLLLTETFDILKWFMRYSKHIRYIENSFNQQIPPRISKFLTIAPEIRHKALSVRTDNLYIRVFKTPLLTFLNIFLLYHTALATYLCFKTKHLQSPKALIRHSLASICYLYTHIYT